MDELQHTSATPREFTIDLLKEITSDFSDKHIVGSGAYAVVYWGVLDKEQIAIKQFRKGLTIEHFNNEFHILKKARHKNIVQLIGYCHHSEDKLMQHENGKYVVATVEHNALCLEYLEGGSLDKHLSYEPCTLDWHECYNIIKGISEGLVYLHEKCTLSIYHLDLKPENILLDKYNSPKIGDFGLSRDFTSTHTMITPEIIGTQGYMPPEYVARRQITSKFDVFSLGVIIIEIIAGQKGCRRYMNEEISPEDLIRHVHSNWKERAPAPVWSRVSLEVKACIQIALKCVEADRTKRPDITTIVEEFNKIEISRNSDQAPNSGLFFVFISPASMVDHCIRSAAGWGLSTAEWMMSPIVALLMNYGSKSGDSEKIKKLVDLVTHIIPELMATSEAAEDITSPDIYRRQFMSRLRSALYDLENILDEVEYGYLEKQLITRKKRRHSSEEDLGPLYKGVGTIESNWTLPGPLNHSLETNMETIENLIFEAHQKFQLMDLQSGSNVRERNPSTAYKPVVFGRDRERDHIKRMLRDTEDGDYQGWRGTRFSVIGIIGMGGSGKTTLAQSVFESERNEGYFDLAMWIHVSRNFSVDSLLREMLGAVSGNIVPHNIHDVMLELNNKLHGKRFFLVLDDVWSGDEQLEKLLFSLVVGKRGSKILVTSRQENVILALGNVRCIRISGLDDETIFELLMHYSLDDGMNDNRHGEELRQIGYEILKKLKGSPLAARIAAGHLRRRPPTVESWRRVLDSNLSSEIMEALWWSYKDLPEQVKRCFVYCGIFPRGYHLYCDVLVNLWVAEGFIKSMDAEQDNIAVGQGYFDELVSASFLMLGGEDSGHSYYLLHDLMHDLAEMLGGSHCFRIGKGWTGEVPQDVRHIFLETCNRDMLTEKIFSLSNLRTLIMYKLEGDIPIEENVLTIMFMKLKKLRVLIVYDCGEHIRVPEVIGQLKYLRYISLKMSSSSSVILPGTLTKLYLMQVLDFGKCSNVTFSYGEEDMVNLVMLRLAVCLATLHFANIGRLTSLQTLSIFMARKEEGYDLKQLRGLNKLQGSLEISDLGVVESKEKALEASLAEKKQLTELLLDWGHHTSNSEEVEAEVLEGLCPPMDLQRLQIRGYQGSRYPTWMVSAQNGPKYLQELELHSCSLLGAIPDSNGFFSHLRLLRFCHCDWDTLPHDMVRLTSLKRLMIHDCLNIRSLPLLPLSVEEFELTGCDEVFMQSCLRTGDENWKRIQYVPMKKIGLYATDEATAED